MPRTEDPAEGRRPLKGPLRAGYNGKFYDGSDRLFLDDRWHCVEAFFLLNTLDLE